MIKKEEVYRIGIFNKPHGVRGEILFTFTDDVFDRVDCEYLICLMDGILVPFFVEEYRFRSHTTALVKLKGINTAEHARRFTNIEIYFPIKYLDKDNREELSWNLFEGFTVTDVNLGVLGTVTQVDTSTLNTLFVIDYQGTELLVPAQEEFVAGVDIHERELTLDLPEGLVDLEKADSDA